MRETDCDLDTPVPDWIIEHPETLAAFQELGIDCSCGGKSLAYACGQRGLNPAMVLTKLNRCLQQRITDLNDGGPSDGHPSCDSR